METSSKENEKIVLQQLSQICITILENIKSNPSQLSNSLKSLNSFILSSSKDQINVITEYVMPPMSIILSNQSDQNKSISLNNKELCIQCITTICKINSHFIWSTQSLLFRYHEWCGNVLSCHPQSYISCDEYYMSIYDLLEALYEDPIIDPLLWNNNTFISLLSYVIFHIKENATNISLSIKTRIKSIQIFILIFNNSSYPFLQSIFPGIISCISKIIIKEKYISHDLIRISLELFNLMNLKVLNNNKWKEIIPIEKRIKEEEKEEQTESKNKPIESSSTKIESPQIKWYKNTILSLRTLLPDVLNNVISLSNHHAVKLTVINVIYNILTHCSNAYYSCFKLLFKYYIVLLNDENEEVKKTANEKIKKYLTDIHNQKYEEKQILSLNTSKTINFITIIRIIEDLLQSEILSLPRIATTTINDELLLHFNVINGCMIILSYINQNEITISIENLLIVIIQCYEMNIDEMIKNNTVIEYNNTNIKEKENKVNNKEISFDFILKKKFLYLSNDKTIYKYNKVVQNLLLCYNFKSIIYSLINNQLLYSVTNSYSLYPSLSYILNLILLKLNYNDIKDITNDLIEYYVMKSSDYSDISNNEGILSMYKVINLEGLSILSNIMKENFNIDCIYTTIWFILENVGSNIDILHQTANRTLEIVAQTSTNNKLSLSQFIEQNIDYIIDGICKRLHYIDYYPNTPIILSFIWKYKEYFNSVQFDDIISCLFDSILESDNIILYLKSIKILTENNDEKDTNIVTTGNNQIVKRKKNNELSENEIKELENDLSTIYTSNVYSLLQDKNICYNIYQNKTVTPDDFVNYILDKYNNPAEPKIISLSTSIYEINKRNEEKPEEYVENPESVLSPYELTIKKIFLNISPYILSKDKQVLYYSLSITENCLKTLSKYKQTLNPLIYKIWDSLVYILKQQYQKDSSVALYREQFNMINNIIALSPDFTYQKFYEDILPHYKQLLKRYLDKEILNENKGVSYQPLVESILKSLDNIPEVVIINNIYEIAESIMFLVNSNIPDHIRILAIKCLLKFCNIDWFSVYQAVLSYFKIHSPQELLAKTQSPITKLFVQLLIK